MILDRERLYVKCNCVDRNILSGPLYQLERSIVWRYLVLYHISGPSAHLETLSDELGHLTVLRVLLPPDDEVDEALGVPQHGGSVGLGHSYQAGAVHLETWNCQVSSEGGVSQC